MCFQNALCLNIHMWTFGETPPIGLANTAVYTDVDGVNYFSHLIRLVLFFSPRCAGKKLFFAKIARHLHHKVRVVDRYNNPQMRHF